MSPEKNTLRDYMRILFRRKGVVIVVFTAVVLSAYAGLLLQTPVYMAEVKILISGAKETGAVYYKNMGVDDAEIATLDQWIRSHTLERFGPVQSVEQVHVFELAYEAIQRSSRHKSGVAVRFPRILRWRTDLAIRDADKLDDLRRLAMD